MAPPSLPKKREVRLPENEELAGKLLEKYRSMTADQPGSLPEPVRVALSAAYRGLCASKEPIRTLRDLRCTKYAVLPSNSSLALVLGWFWSVYVRFGGNAAPLSRG
jgi:hypothetical protein